MSRIEVLVEGVPVAKGRARSTRAGHHYTPGPTLAGEAAVQVAWLRQGGRFPRLPTGSVRVHVVATFLPPKKWTKARRDAAAGEGWPHTGHPDMDNLLKLVCDALNGYAWLDDGQVSELSGRKQYGRDATTRITVFYPPNPTEREQENNAKHADTD